VHPIAALQTEYSLWSREPEAELLATCAELGITFVAYSPLGRGFLTGRIRSTADLQPGDWRLETQPRFQGDNFQHNLALVAAVEAVARSKGCTPAQVALAWLLSTNASVDASSADAFFVIPIPGSTRPERVAENAGAVQVELTRDDRAALETLASAVAGDRYAERGMTLVNR
jgi:aryl-alcohol dehydrogenase-like predicted oxidoreductase